jgi:hypothetical protein
MPRRFGGESLPMKPRFHPHHVILSIFCSLCGTLPALTEIPAFPGAEGFAAHSIGGRGGDIYQVTNLNAKGPGSFLEGISTVPPQGRTIVFAVSGFIPINKARLSASKVTIAGQTAPGGGICLTGSSFTISGADIIIRHLRFRHGAKGNGGDCINPDGGANNLIIDHCDVMFSADENLSSFRTAPPTMTFQWSTNAWGIYGHSCGGLWLIDHATAHHTLWANNKTRNPKVICPKLLDWTNNVTFGWDIGMNLAGADKPGLYKANIRGNSFIQGSRGRNAIFGGGILPDGTMPYHIFLEDSIMDGNGTATPDITAEGYALIDKDQYHKSPKPFPQTLAADPAKPNDPIIGVPVKIDDRLTAYKKVISQVGPLRPDVTSPESLRDEVTTLLVNEVVQQKRRKLTHESETGLPNKGLGILESHPALPDTDKDAMPDIWEQTLGSDPAKYDANSPVASPSFFPKNTPAGYTRLEEYLHFLAIPHGMIAKAKPVTIDLRKFTSGFTKNPVFKGSDIHGGTIQSDGPGRCLVTFTPNPGHTGRAGFDFTVTDADGSTWTQSCALLVH